MDGTKSTDRLFAEFKELCANLRAKGSKERATAVKSMQRFLSDDVHRYYIHRWHQWGYLFSALLCATIPDIQTYLGLQLTNTSSLVIGTKRRKTSIPSKSTKPKVLQLDLWHYLRTEYLNAHAILGPMLHLDVNGRDFLMDLFEFAISVLHHHGIKSSVAARGEAWQSLQIIVQYRVYCAILSKSQVIEIITLVIDSQGEEEETNTNITLFVSVLSSLLQNNPYDLHDQIASIIAKLAHWLDRVQPNSSQQCLDAAPHILACVTTISRSHFSTSTIHLVEHGSKLLHYVQRDWRRLPYRLRIHLAHFIVIYVQIYDSYMDHICVLPNKLLRDLRGLVGIVLDPKELQKVLLSLRSGRGAMGLVAASAVASGFGVGSCGMIELDTNTVAFLTCAADVVYFHDRLLAQWAMCGNEEVDGSEDEMKEEIVSRIRPREVITTSRMAWEKVLEQVLVLGGINEASVSSTQGVPHRGKPSHHTIVPWLLMTCIMCRHGAYYIKERIGDVLEVTNQAVEILESATKDVDIRQLIALHLMIQLTSYQELERDLGEDLWNKVWLLMVRMDLPYLRTLTSTLGHDQPGELVCILLTKCLEQQLVSRSVVLSSACSLWKQWSVGFPPNKSNRKTGLSTAPITLIALLIESCGIPEDSIGSTKDSEVARENDERKTSLRYQILEAVLGHMQVVMSTESVTDATSTDGQLFPVAYANVISSFLMVTRHKVARECIDDLQRPTILVQLSRMHDMRTHSEGNILLGFGVYFPLYEWGMEQMYTAYDHGTRTVMPNDFSPLLREIRQSVGCSRRAAEENGLKFRKHSLPAILLRGLYHPDLTDQEIKIHQTIPLVSSLAKDTLQSLCQVISTRFTEMINHMSNELCASDSESPRVLSILHAIMMLGVTMSLLYSKLYGTQDNERVKFEQAGLGLSNALRRFLHLLSDHLTTPVIHRARVSESDARLVVGIFSKFNSLILVLQGSETIYNMQHPCADPVDLRIPSELRIPIRKIVSAIEASLELVQDDIPHQNTCSHSYSRSREITPTSLSASWDWDMTELPASSGAVVMHTSSGSINDLPPSPSSSSSHQVSDVQRACEMQKILSLWSLRVVLLLKKESGVKAVREHVYQLDFSADLLLAVATMVCGIPGCESLDVVIKLIQASVEQAGIASMTTTYACQAGSVVLLLGEISRVLFHCALVYEGRKQDHHEEIPKLLLTTARSYLNRMALHPLISELRIARQTHLSTLEAFFRLLPDSFEELVEVTMTHLSDKDVFVRLAAVESSQSVYYMYPDGSVQVFEELYTHLQPSLPIPHESQENQLIENSMVLLSFLAVSAMATAEVVPEVLKRIIDLALRTDGSAYTYSGMLQVCVQHVAKYYQYPTVSQFIEDHFSVLWSRYLTNIEPEVTAAMVLQNFPLQWLLSEEDSHDMCVRNIDAIMPLAIVYDAMHHKGRQFPLVHGLVSLLCPQKDGSHTLDEQLTTDLIALSFIFQAGVKLGSKSDDSRLLHETSTTIRLAVEDRVLISALSSAHLSVVLMKMARLLIYNLTFLPVSDDKQQILKIWTHAIQSIQSKTTIATQVPELLCSFHVLILQCTRNQLMMSLTIECFCLWVNVYHQLMKSFVVQQLVLHVSFQALHCIPRQLSTAIHSVCYSIRTLCEVWIQEPSCFGQYLDVIVREMVRVLSGSQVQGEARVHLEWVVFAICNHMTGELGKYTIEKYCVPLGIASCLDKLHALVSSPEGGDSPSHMIQQMIQSITQTGHRFYRPWAQVESGKLQHLQEILEDLSDHPHEAWEQGLKDVIGRLARTLLTLGVTSYGKQDDILAHLLSTIGVWDTRSMVIPQGNEELNRLYHQHFKRNALVEMKSTFLEHMYEQLLVFLASICFESGTKEWIVLDQVIQAIRGIVQAREGTMVLTKCKDAHLCAFLEPFLQSLTSHWVPSGCPRSARSTSVIECWRSYSTNDFETWISTLTSILIGSCQDPILSTCRILVKERCDLAIFLFPYVIWTLLQAKENHSLVSTIHQGIIEMMQSQHSTTEALKAIQLMIHTIHFLRETEKMVFLHGKAPPAGQIAYTCLVQVDLLDIAEACIRVQMPFSAMQYVEMWLEQCYGNILPSGWDMTDRVRTILVEAYGMATNVDGLYGINDARTIASQLVQYTHEGHYAKALPLYDLSVQVGMTQPLIEGMLNTLNQLGYDYLLRGNLENLLQHDHQGLEMSCVEEYQYELAWKSLQWESRREVITSRYRHQQTIHTALGSLAHQDTSQVLQSTQQAKNMILSSIQLSLLGLESTQEVVQALLQLQMIQSIEDCAHIMTTMSQVAPALQQLSRQWKNKRTQVLNDYDASERLLSLEEVLIQVCLPEAQVSERHDLLATTYLAQTTISRHADRVAIAYKSLLKLERLYEKGYLRLDFEFQWKIEKAKLLWSQQERRSAIWIAKQVVQELSILIVDSCETKLVLQYVDVLRLTGSWIAFQRSESSQVIIDEYLRKATILVDQLQGLTDHEQDEAAKAHFTFAEFMADMYHQVSTRIQSHEWKVGKQVADARHRELQSCYAMHETKRQENRAHIYALNQEVQYDLQERAKVEQSLQEFLIGALHSFGRGLVLSSHSDLAHVFHVLSLWFNGLHESDIHQVMQSMMETVPSYKFVPLSYQLISRVDGKKDEFQQVLSTIVLKLCQQHPYHALIQLITLKNSNDVEGKGAKEYCANIGETKSTSARTYIETLRTTSLCELIDILDVLSNAYIQLALYDTRDFHKQGKHIPFSKIPIIPLQATHRKISFDQCLRDRLRRGTSRILMPAVLTQSLSPRPDMDYSNVIRVQGFESTFSITDSGIHRPKIIYCLGSDGNRYKQLVKGKDDTRQDLVIEQVFDTVNYFLQQELMTKQRHLRICTYKVVPLSPIAGVLEWVDHTIPWGSYLVGRTSKRLSAHERYHPHEWKHSECRLHLKNASDKYKAYREIEQHFTPVFHHFFLEKYPDAVLWYHRRLAFIQSAAVSSIVGYILGIGDRHSQNILIHEQTAELVHIDFGVVFDQGMALFTPETIPFRLTRDLVDGMGVSGCEGVFTRCCEATMQVLRKKRASLITILEVFIHDPLYRWTLSPLKALRIQEAGANGGSDSDPNEQVETTEGGTKNDAAKRALFRVKQKLEGYEDPNGNALSIEGQVKQLISAAQDPHRLCALFPGWAPWL